MAQVFVVMLTIGYGDDRHTTAHKVFVGADDDQTSPMRHWRATNYVEQANRAVAEVNGMLQALANMMAVWEKAHPHPLDAEGRGFQTTPEEDEECERWRLRRDAERQRLFDACGIVDAMKDANVPDYERDIYTPEIHMRYFIAEDVVVESY